MDFEFYQKLFLYLLRLSYILFFSLLMYISFFLYWSFDHYVMFVFVFCNSLYFKICFFWKEYCYSGFLLISFLWDTFFHLLTLRWCVSLNLKWVSCSMQICRSYFCFHSASLYLLVWVFSPFTFKVIINVYVPMAIC